MPTLSPGGICTIEGMANLLHHVDIDHQVATKSEPDDKTGRAQDRAKAGHTGSRSASRADGLWQEARETAGRQIEVHQNWLARLFRVKPATRHICFSISKRRARQEVAILLREWRQYGMKDIQVDKERNIVFARVSRKNCKFRLTKHTTLRTGIFHVRPRK